MSISDLLSLIDSEITQLQQARALLAGTRGGKSAGSPSIKRKRTMSAAARKRIGDAQRKRWAEVRAKKAAKPAPATVEKKAAAPPAKKRKMSAAARKRIAAAQKKRWAAIRAAKKSAKTAPAKKVGKEDSGQEVSGHKESSRQEGSCGEGEESCPGEGRCYFNENCCVLRKVSPTKSPGCKVPQRFAPPCKDIMKNEKNSRISFTTPAAYSVGVGIIVPDFGARGISKRPSWQANIFLPCFRVWNHRAWHRPLAATVLGKAFRDGLSGVRGRGRTAVDGLLSCSRNRFRPAQLLPSSCPLLHKPFQLLNRVQDHPVDSGTW